MSNFYPHISVEPALVVKTNLKDDYISGQSFDLYKDPSPPKTITLLFEVSVSNWNQAIHPSERKLKKSVMDVWVKVESFSSIFSQNLILKKKGRNWTGKMKLNSNDFVSSAKIQAFVIRNIDYKGTPNPQIASKKSLLLGESGEWSLNFVQSDSSGSSIPAEWVDFQDQGMNQAFKNSHELFGVDLENENIKLYFNRDIGTDRNKDIQDITNWDGINKEKIRNYLNKSIAISIHVSLLSSALMELSAGLQKNQQLNAEEVIDDLLSSLDKKIVLTYLRFLYPELSDKQTRLVRIKSDLIDENQRKNLIVTRCLLAVQAQLKLVDTIRIAADLLKNSF